jgi:hypothetical protein
VTATKIVPGLLLGWFNFQTKRLGILPQTEGAKGINLLLILLLLIFVIKYPNDEL